MLSGGLNGARFGGMKFDGDDLVAVIENDGGETLANGRTPF